MAQDEYTHPQDHGTGTAYSGQEGDKGDANDAARLGALVGATKPVSCLVRGCTFSNVGSLSFDIDAGKVYTVGDNLGVASGTEERDEVGHVNGFSGATDVSLTDNTTNHIYLAADLDQKNVVNPVVNTTGSDPSNPSVKIGEIDTNTSPYTVSEQWNLLAEDGTLSYPDADAANTALNNFDAAVTVYDRTNNTQISDSGVSVPTLEATTSITDPEGNTVTSLSDPVRVTNEASTFAESNVTITHTNTTVSNSSIELDGTQTSGHAIVAFDSGSPADIDSWDLATFQRTLDGETATIDLMEPVSSDVIDDFEDNNITVENSVYDGWKGDTSSLSAQNSTILSGQYSGELTSNDAFNEVSVSQNSPDTVDEIAVQIQIDNQSSNSSDKVAVQLGNDGGGDILSVDFTDGSTVDVNGTTVLASWSVGTQYNITLTNIDFTAETFDVDINGTTKTDISFSNSSSAMEFIIIQNDSNTSNTTRNVYIDNLKETGATVSTDANTLQSNISKDTDISSIETPTDVQFRANLSRNDTSNNPTVDYLARRFTR